MARSFDPKKTYVDEWVHAGIVCRIAGGATSLNGYVVLPGNLREAWSKIEHWDYPIDVHGGITYGIDPEGVIGFDTAHCYDFWALDDVIGRVKVTSIQALSTAHNTMAGMKMARRWTMERLRAEVEHLADQVAAEAVA